MYKKILAAVLLLAMLLSLASCGGGTTGGGETNTPSGTTSQPTQGTETSQPTQGTETTQPTEEPAAVSFIFSDRPVAAYEVTGFDLHSVYEENYIDKAGDDFGNIPFVKLSPGENSFVIFCMEADFELAGSVSVAAIHSPDGSSRWVSRYYSCFDAVIDNLPEGYAMFYSNPDYSYGEGDYDGGYLSLMDAFLYYISFSKLYHPDAAQDDSICVVDVAEFPGNPGFDGIDIDGVVAAVADIFEELGGVAVQIPVDEALARCHIEVE